MSKLTRLSMVFVVGFAISYLLGSFCNASLNFKLWPQDARVLTCMLSLIPMFLLYEATQPPQSDKH